MQLDQRFEASKQQDGTIFATQPDDARTLPPGPQVPAGTPAAQAGGDRKPSPVLVVGDKFAAFSDGALVFTLPELLRCLERGDQPITEVVVGQGIGLAALNGLRKSLLDIGARVGRQGPRPVLREHVSHRIAHDEVHKRRPENVLISRPVRTGAHTHAAQLILDDGADDIADHVTGIHVPGMCIVEAARQACLAVAGALAEESGYEMAESVYTLNTLEVNFSKFIYPSEVRIEIHAPPWHAVGCDGVYQGVLDIGFIQYNLVAAKVKVVSTRHPSPMLARLEHAGSRQHFRRLLRSISLRAGESRL